MNIVKTYSSEINSSFMLLYFQIRLREFLFNFQVHELKQSRQLASEITSTGATLYDLLGKEVDLRVT